MPTLEAWSLRVHVAAGVVAILAGAIALTTAKGGLRHRRAGKAFVAAMAVVVGTVPVLLALDSSPSRIFLTLVAVFSGYLAFSGYRVLSRKRPIDDAATVDWVAAAAVVVACLAMGSWGVAQVADGRTFGVVLVVFGGIGLSVGVGDVRQFRTHELRDPWTVAHLQRMLAAFIATITAVSAVNLTPYVGVAAWLWPTVVGVPLVVYWSSKYEQE